MTSVSLTRRSALLATLSSPLLLAACGGGGGDGNGNANIRAINLTSDLPSADLYFGDTKSFSALTTDTLVSSISVEANTYTLGIKSAGQATFLFTRSYSLAKDQNYAAVIWGRQSALQLSNLGESEDATDVDATTTRLRMLNATLDSGTVDVYVTDEDTELSSTTATQSSLTGGALSPFRSLTAKTQRIRVTGAGNIDDVRLDVSGVALAGKTFYTLVITPAGSGGVLLDATLIAQGSASTTTAKNTFARIRVAASVESGGVVAVRSGTTFLQTNVTSPRIGLTSGSYKKVTAGTVPLAVQVNGVTLASSGNVTLTAGSDYTLLVYGSAADPQYSLLLDDNRLPLVASRAKVRLINGVPGTALLSAVVSASSNSNTADVAAGAASPYINVLASGSTAVDVYSSESFQSLFNKTAATNTNLLAVQGVYTVFMLSGGASPTGFWVSDR